MRRLSIVLFIMLVVSALTAYAGEWRQDENGWRYQNDDGTYKKGWHQDVNTKWFYFDSQTAYMLSNTITPDGYTVAPDGSWSEGGNSIINVDGKTYDRKVDLDVSAYFDREIHQLGYTVPVAIYYNEEYQNERGRKVNITGMETSEDGALYIKYKMGAVGFSYELNAQCKYILEDGTEKIVDEKIMGSYWSEDIDANVSFPILLDLAGLKKKPVSVSVCIELMYIR